MSLLSAGAVGALALALSVAFLVSVKLILAFNRVTVKPADKYVNYFK